MKAIISHDIDHIKVWEHLMRDTILPKFILRSNIELILGKISLSEFLSRAEDFFSNKWQRIEELIVFNKQMGIPSSFFIGVENGLGLSYQNAASAYWIKKMSESGCEVGVHSLGFESFDLVKKEFDRFASTSQIKNFGNRMHYMRSNDLTFPFLALAGYKYDSTEHSFKNPYKIGKMWEFPIQIMDGWMIEKGKRWQTQNLSQAIENTKLVIDKAHSKNLTHLGIDFHDRYFSKSFQTWLDWYVWLTGYLKQNGIEFVNFDKAILELEKEEGNYISSELSQGHTAGNVLTM